MVTAIREFGWWPVFSGQGASVGLHLTMHSENYYFCSFNSRVVMKCFVVTLY